jgi:hypothetical protein
MPLDPTLYLAVAVKAANALCKRNPYLDRDEAHGQALLELVLLAEAYDPRRDRHRNPTRYLTWAVKRRLIDWLRTLGPLDRREYRRRLQAGNPVPNRVKLGPLTEPAIHDDPAQNLQAQDVIARVRQIVGEREWPIILAILEDRPAWTAGPALGVSEGRISQLKSALFARLRESSLKAFLEDQLCPTS